MIYRIAEYTVRQGEVDAVPETVEWFVAAVQSAEPGTEYHAYHRGETHSFVHVMAFPDTATEQAHREAEYTSDFVAALYPRCVEEPRFTELHAVRE